MSVFCGVSVNTEDLEFVADEIRRRARIRSNEVLRAATIAHRLLGLRGIRFGVSGVLPHYDPVRQHIVIPENYGDANFAIAHELAEIAFRVWTPRTFKTHREKECAADYVAAAVLAPPQLVRAEVRRRRGDIAQLASFFGVSQSTMVLRIAEVLKENRAIVTRKNHIHVRGELPPIDLVQFARTRDSEHPGLMKTELTGKQDVGRVALHAC